MSNNQSNTGLWERLAKITPAEWVMIGGIVSVVLGVYINIIVSNASNKSNHDALVKELSEHKNMIKEINIDYKSNFKDLEKKYIDLAIRQTISETKLNELDRRR